MLVINYKGYCVSKIAMVIKMNREVIEELSVLLGHCNLIIFKYNFGEHECIYSVFSRV